MNIFRLAFELFMLYLLYKLVFDFIIPIFRTTNQVKRQFGEMHAKMQEKMYEQQQQYANNQSTTNSQHKTAKEGKDDYIDFEEVKTN